MKITNARIKSTSLEIERDNLTFWIWLDYGDMSGQGFGGYKIDGEYCAKVVRGILTTLEIDRWEQLPGMHVRAMSDDGDTVMAIGHFIKDRWFDIRMVE